MWTEGAGARDAHIRLRLHVGALRQQRHNHIQVVLFTGGDERRPSVLRHMQNRGQSYGAAQDTALLYPPHTHTQSHVYTHRAVCTMFYYIYHIMIMGRP
jgi:hypothetical protein